MSDQCELCVDVCVHIVFRVALFDKAEVGILAAEAEIFHLWRSRHNTFHNNKQDRRHTHIGTHKHSLSHFHAPLRPLVGASAGHRLLVPQPKPGCRKQSDGLIYQAPDL